MKITRIRSEIDKIDSEIIELLSKRGTLVSEAGKLKKNEKAVRDQERVNIVIEKVKRQALKKGLDPHVAEKIYTSIIDCFLNREMREFRENRFYFPDI